MTDFHGHTSYTAGADVARLVVPVVGGTWRWQWSWTTAGATRTW